MSEGLTIKSSGLGRALRQARKALGLSGAAFCTEIYATGGPSLTKSQLSFIENGTRGLRLDDWRKISAALVALGTPHELVAALGAELPSSNAEPEVERSLPETVADLRTTLDQLTQQPLPVVEEIDGVESDRGAGTAALLARYAPIAQQVLSMLTSAETVTTQPDPRDRVRVRAITPTEARVVANQLFEFTVELDNVGPIAWQQRLLLRLGPPVTSTLAQTAPLLPVPDTPAGGTCQIQIPGRAHFLPGACVITYVMIFSDGTPCLPGGLALPITSIGPTHRALPVSAKVAKILRSWPIR